MSDFEPFKKQAKLYLRWHQQGYVPVAVPIRQHLARFHEMTDQEVLEAPFKLSDAQILVARQHGFETWSAFKESFQSMETPRSVSAPKPSLLSVEPQLFVTDLEPALRFYRSGLGFELVFSYGAPPFYAQINRDGVRLNLRSVTGPVFDQSFRDRERDALAATIAVAAIKPVFLEFQAAGVPFHQRLRTEPWGARTFIVEDPDGNLICFSGPDDAR